MEDQRGPSAEGWSRLNAIVLLAATAAGLITNVAWPPAVAAVLSAGWFIFREAPYWTPSGRFGLANATTALRMCLVVGLGLVQVSAGWSLAIIIPGLACLALDGVDGYLARRRGDSSVFGSYFDKEVDAAMVLVLSVQLYLFGRLPIWIISLGLLRYLFVLFTWAVPRSQGEKRSWLARVSYVLVVAACLIGFAPFPKVYLPLGLAAALILTMSFGRSTWQILNAPE